MNSLFHDLEVDLGHVNLLAELRREFGALEELGVHSGRHGGLRYGRIDLRWLLVSVEIVKIKCDVARVEI